MAIGAVAYYDCGEVVLASIWRPERMKNDYIISCPKECNKEIFSALFYDEDAILCWVTCFKKIF
jgi:hypothetical protein